MFILKSLGNEFAHVESYSILLEKRATQVAHYLSIANCRIDFIKITAHSLLWLLVARLTIFAATKEATPIRLNGT